MSMIETLRSGVNTWECDHMGHMNVRHYFARANQGLSGLLLALGLSPSRLRREQLAVRATDQHVRFLREMRPGSYYTLRVGLTDCGPEQLEVYGELAFVQRPELAASVLSRIALVDTRNERPVPWPADCLARADALRTSVPERGVARGIQRTPPRTPPTREQAETMGMVGAYMAPVEPEDCDQHGVMLEAAFMARVSDGIGHFFHTLQATGVRNTGGAALEYRYVFHSRPRLGDLIEVRSGLKAVGNKTKHFCHFVYDVESGGCAASSEAVAVSFDLHARRALALTDAERAVMEARVIPGLAI